MKSNYFIKHDYFLWKFKYVYEQQTHMMIVKIATVFAKPILLNLINYFVIYVKILSENIFYH